MNMTSLFRITHQAITSTIPRLLSLNIARSAIDHKMYSMCNKQNFNLPSNVQLSYSAATSLLQPVLPMYNLVCGIKVKRRLDIRCSGCYYVWRKERLYVMCKKHPRHKQTQMKKREYKTWILTSASQKPKREW